MNPVIVPEKNKFYSEMNVLVTGAAGFIGSSLMMRLAGEGVNVVGIDSINDYYDVELKYARLERCGLKRPFIGSNVSASSTAPCISFARMDICDKDGMDRLFKEYSFDAVVNLAAQAGVRYSITNPYSYLHSNLEGFLVLLETCRKYETDHLVFASSSSVYGLNTKVPYSEEDRVDMPVSLYAATKKSDELMAFAYSRLYGIRCTGLRYFTVYGPWGRPDMAPFLFAEAISAGKPIKVFNHGDMIRDFTYIDDIVEGTLRVVLDRRSDNTARHQAGYSIYNIGCSTPVRLMDFIAEIEDALGRKAVMEMLPMQQGDVYETYADTSRLEQDYGYKPCVSLHEGIARFISWYKEYNKK